MTKSSHPKVKKATTLPGFTTRPLSVEGITTVTSCISERELKNIRDSIPSNMSLSTYFVNLEGFKREIIDLKQAEVVGIFGIMRREKHAIIPWLLFKEDYSPPNPAQFVEFCKEFLKGLMAQEQACIVVCKDAEDPQWLPLIDKIGFKRMPELTHKGANGNTYHLYALLPMEAA
ncbi:MAG: hypothetical protein SFW64_03660 [Alphaproteobacteria bacterium]|nr:hypothetical protein [Alphaproteobacteria bacterium]